MVKASRNYTQFWFFMSHSQRTGATNPAGISETAGPWRPWETADSDRLLSAVPVEKFKNHAFSTFEEIYSKYASFGEGILGVFSHLQYCNLEILLAVFHFKNSFQSFLNPRSLQSWFGAYFVITGPQQQTADRTALSRNKQKWVACNKQILTVVCCPGRGSAVSRGHHAPSRDLNLPVRSRQHTNVLPCFGNNSENIPLQYDISNNNLKLPILNYGPLKWFKIINEGVGVVP